MTPNYCKYEDIREQILDADLLLFRRQPTLISKIISVGGRSRYSHAGMAVWYRPSDQSLRPILLCAEVRELKGGRAVTLSSQVKLFDRSIDVYRPRDRRCVPAAATAMMRKAGEPYAYRGLWAVAKNHLPIFAFSSTVNMDDSAPSGPQEFCSQAVSSAYRAGGVDPVPNLADCDTEPGDLGRSEFFTYQFTLTT